MGGDAMKMVHAVCLLAAMLFSMYSSAPAAKDLVVKIGVAGPLTGSLSHMGKDIENGASLAVEEANASHPALGGKPVRFESISEDDQADPKTAVIVAQRLVDDGVSAVIGHFNSGCTIPASRVYHDAGIPQVSPSSTNPTFTAQGFDTAFRVIGSDAYVGKVAAEYMVRTYGAKRVAVVDDRSAYGQGLADVVDTSLKAAGAEVVGREYTTTQATDFKAILTNIKGKNAQAVFFGGLDAQAGPMVRQMRELGIGAKLFASAIESQAFLDLAGPGAEGAVSAQSGSALERMPGGKDFVERFAKYGNVVMYAPHSYDAARAVVAAMRKADSANPGKFLPYLREISFDGVTGPIAFDEHGDLRRASVTFYEVRNGKWATIGSVTLK
jgi:branched-chain amino acid transport system substrate-binding protein